jgi:tetratricopeptide (TPR) repeat protein
MNHRRVGKTVLALMLLASVVLAMYWQVREHSFVTYDDDVYILDNPRVRDGLTWDGVRWAFTTTHAANWHPLTWLSHMLDCQLFGVEPGSHHLSSVVLHAANVALLFLALFYLTGGFWPSLLVAAIFAVHPLRVESVAWAAERKDLLAGFFWMTTMLAYCHYARRPRPGRYLPVFLSLALGLMAKPMLVTLPCVLLLLDFWPLRRSPLRWLILEKLPLCGLAAASCTVTVIAQSSGGAVSATEILPLGWRSANALTSYVGYLWKSIWPSGLAFYYPHPAILSTGVFAFAILGSLLLAAGTYLALRHSGRHPYVTVGWLWYLGTLVPVIGLVQVGSQAMADRYAYLPLIGIYIAVAWSLAAAVSRWPRIRTAVAGALCLALAALALATWRQAGHWRDSRALYEHALLVTERNYLAHNGLGNVLQRAGALDEAMVHFERALAIKPDFAIAHNNLGVLLKNRGDLAGAAAHYEHAIRVKPDFSQAHSNLGNVLARQGDLAGAAEHYRRAIEIDPGRPAPLINLGNLFFSRGDFAEAILQYERALLIDPGLADAHKNIGVSYERLGDLPKAVVHYRRALEIDPRMSEVAGRLRRLRSPEDAGTNRD